MAAATAAAVVVTALMCALPAGASQAPPAWVPVTRDLRHANAWVLAGESASRRIAGTHARVLFVGDSITQWWTRYGSGAWAADFEPLGASDDGVAGDTTSNVLARLNDGSLAGLDPRVVVVMIGTNNIALHQTAADIARGVMSVVADLRARLPGAEVLLLGLLPRGMPGSTGRTAAAAVDRLLAAGAPAAGVTYLDAGTELLGPDGRFLPAAMHADLLHPDAAGYRLIAARVAPVVRRLLGAAAA